MLTYDNFERISVGRPVDRLSFISGECANKTVLDLGCLDETALTKQDTSHWLHGRIATVATAVIGIDSSKRVPPEGLSTAKNARIQQGDATRLELDLRSLQSIQVVVAGEFIEHLECPLDFLRTLKGKATGKNPVAVHPQWCEHF